MAANKGDVDALTAGGHLGKAEMGRVARTLAEWVSDEPTTMPQVLCHLLPRLEPVTSEAATHLANVAVKGVFVDGAHQQVCLATLEALVRTAPKEVMPLWSDILPSDAHDGLFRLTHLPTIYSVLSELFKHAAGSWVMARDPAHRAFTTHSERIGAFVVHTRQALANALERDASPAVLACTLSFLEYTRDEALHTSHEHVLRPCVERCCASPDPDVALHAYAILARWPNPPRAIPDLLRLGPHAWHVIATYLPWEEESIEAVLGAVPPDVDPAVLVALMNATHSPHIWAKHRTALTSLMHSVPPLSACHAWPSYTQVHSAHALPMDDCVQLLIPHLDSSLSVIRAAAIRAVGVVWEQTPPATFEWARRYLALMRDPDLVVRMRAAWTWANASHAQYDGELYATLLAAMHDDDRVRVHAVRGLGCMLHNAPSDAYADGVRMASMLLQSRMPKVRWNAATCLARAMHRRPNALLPLCVSSLAAALRTDSTFKVQRVAAHALNTLHEEDVTHLPAPIQSELCDAITFANTHITTRIRAASFAEAQVHGYACMALLHSLQERARTWQEQLSCPARSAAATTEEFAAQEPPCRRD